MNLKYKPDDKFTKRIPRKAYFFLFLFEFPQMCFSNVI